MINVVLHHSPIKKIQDHSMIIEELPALPCCEELAAWGVMPIRGRCGGDANT